MNVYTNGAYRRQGVAYKMTTMLIEEAWNSNWGIGEGKETC